MFSEPCCFLLSGGTQNEKLQGLWHGIHLPVGGMCTEDSVSGDLGISFREDDCQSICSMYVLQENLQVGIVECVWSVFLGLELKSFGTSHKDITCQSWTWYYRKYAPCGERWSTGAEHFPGGGCCRMSVLPKKIRPNDLKIPLQFSKSLDPLCRDLLSNQNLR